MFILANWLTKKYEKIITRRNMKFYAENSFRSAIFCVQLLIAVTISQSRFFVKNLSLLTIGQKQKFRFRKSTLLKKNFHNLFLENGTKFHPKFLILWEVLMKKKIHQNFLGNFDLDTWEIQTWNLSKLLTVHIFKYPNFLDNRSCRDQSYDWFCMSNSPNEGKKKKALLKHFAMWFLGSFWGSKI
jgi:hypothetical protein